MVDISKLQINKCCYRIKIEKILELGIEPLSNDLYKSECLSCNGNEELKYKCSDYIDIDHILKLYELFK